MKTLPAYETVKVGERIRRKAVFDTSIVEEGKSSDSDSEDDDDYGAPAANLSSSYKHQVRGEPVNWCQYRILNCDCRFILYMVAQNQCLFF